MKLDFEQVKSVTLGAASVKQTQNGIHFQRFTDEQIEVYKTYNDVFSRKVRCTSGVEMRFLTNSENLCIKGFTGPGSTRTYYAFDVLVNGSKIGRIDNFAGLELPQDYTTLALPLGDFAATFSLGSGEKEVRIVFPWSVESGIYELELDDDATLVPVKPKRKMLCFGDSITHGYDALEPTNKYITRLADALGVEEFNKAIGGECFFPQLADTKENFVPDIITVAYGTNDWSSRSLEHLVTNSAAFYEKLSANYPNSQIFAITPIWRKDYRAEKPCGTFADVEKIISAAVAKLDNVTLISGFDFVPQEENYFADLRLHPNDEGFRWYFEALYAKMKAFLK